MTAALSPTVFHCDACGADSYNALGCLMCNDGDAPPTLRDPPGPKWWEVNIAPQPPLPSGEEWTQLKQMMDAIREMIDLEPLYTKRKLQKPHNGLPIYDERENDWKR
jgi:hypothetical protein